ncbi:MAG TPA: DegT/DnrJ/EryC1/StrS family aminotransferase [Acidimicrobiales bacterium]|nr:DegT/DnrJ/EryC1/StrS family aminotransferase [Acidimicrobiales bacterium]
MDREIRAVPLGFPSLGVAELEAVNETFRSGWVAGQGPRTRALEEAFATHSGVAHAIAVNNCTAGLHLALLALGVGPGDEVLVADYTFPATGHAVLFCGARPVFVDVRPDTATIDPRAIEVAITPRTRGVVAVDALGQVADYAEIEAIADTHGLFVLEDAACAAGAVYHDRPTGSFGDVACFSLHGRKGITCGEGGVVTTDDQVIADRVRKLSCFGMESAFVRQQSAQLPIPEFDELGYNYKLSDILAAIAYVQLQRLDELLARRRRVAARYAEGLRSMAHITVPAEPADREHVFQSYAITVDAPLQRDRVAIALRDRDIGCNIGTYASHLQPIYATPDGVPAPCPTSARLFRQHLALPMHAELSDSDVDHVVAVLGDVIDQQLAREA